MGDQGAVGIEGPTGKKGDTVRLANCVVINFTLLLLLQGDEGVKGAKGATGVGGRGGVPGQKVRKMLSVLRSNCDHIARTEHELRDKKKHLVLPFSRPLHAVYKPLIHNLQETCELEACNTLFLVHAFA